MEREIKYVCPADLSSERLLILNFLGFNICATHLQDTRNSGLEPSPEYCPTCPYNFSRKISDFSHEERVKADLAAELALTALHSRRILSRRKNE